MKNRALIQKELEEHLQIMQAIGEPLQKTIADVANMMCACLEEGNKILVAGNGGSAADAQHFAAELVGRFTRNRKALAAIALTTDTSALTAIANDFGYDDVFSRQLEGLGQSGDMFLAISTSGNSANLVKALNTAHHAAIKTVALLGKSGGSMKDIAERSIIVPSNTTQRIQEVHEWILHTWCACIDSMIGRNERDGA